MPEPVELEFVPSAAVLSLGVEQELQVLDARTLRLTPRAPEILERAHDLIRHTRWPTTTTGW